MALFIKVNFKMILRMDMANRPILQDKHMKAISSTARSHKSQTYYPTIFHNKIN